jgi:hypothetical protein
MTLSIKGLNVTLSINDAEHNNGMHYAECRYADCRILSIVMLIVVMLSISMLNIPLLSVMAPFRVASFDSCSAYLHISYLPNGTARFA